MNDFLTTPIMLYDLVSQAQLDSQVATVRVTLDIRKSGAIPGTLTLLNLDQSIYQQVNVLVGYWTSLFDLLADVENKRVTRLQAFAYRLEGVEEVAVEQLSRRFTQAA